jgi:signal transduction histidine kinase/ActR/RegA family two-component response regulator
MSDMNEAANVALHPATELAELRSEVARLTALLAELRQRDAHLRIAMQGSNVVAYEWNIVQDRVTRLRSSSEPGAALEDAGNFESVVARVLEEDQQTFRNDIAAALASDDGGYRTEVRYQRPDGEIRWVSESGRVLRDEQGRSERMVGVTFDITDRKHAEEALRQAEGQLREQAERKDEFLAMLAHELRNPLAPIRNAVQILRLIGTSESKADKAYDIIERQVGQLVRLVDDLLDVSRVSRGKVTLHRETIDLRDVARHALDTSQPLLSARGHAVQLSLPSEPVRVLGDAGRLAQVLSNLLNNAAKYTDAGGRVEVAVTQEEEAVITVRDNGRGLDAADQARVFDMFYQAERDLDRSEGGLGLGLALVKRLVELHGGAVRAPSPGRGLGSAFSVRLPLAGVPVVSQQGTGQTPVTPAVRALRVLVVDDLPDAAETMAELLQLMGHDVLTAIDGGGAVELALRERPDLVLLDIGLPGLNGFEACRSMREGGLTGTVIVAVSGYGNPEDRGLSQVAGFDEHLVKPVDPALLRALVDRCASRGAE